MNTETEARLAINVFALMADLAILFIGLLIMPGVFGDGFPIKVFWFCVAGYLIVEFVKWIMLVILLAVSGGHNE